MSLSTKKALCLDTEGKIPLTMGLISNHTLLAGETGSGKSYGIGVICEILSKMGVPFIVVDTQGANKGLVALPHTKICNPNKIKPKRAGAEVSSTNVNCVIVKPQKWGMSQYRIYVNDFLRNYLIREQKAVRILFVDEAHLHTPRNAITEDSEILKNIATSYRAEGFFLYSSTQRLVELSKTVENESLNNFFFRLSGFNDLQRLRDTLRLRFNKDEAEALIEQVRNFEQGECMLITPEQIYTGGTLKQSITKEIVELEQEE
ncbi:MAG: helicase HerA-like domain-containing protein [Promethearchaeota archaeon]